MNRAAAVPIIALVTHAGHVAAIELERFIVTLRRESAGRGSTLDTCHRVEACFGSGDDAARLAPAVPPGGRALTGAQAVHHAMSVAVGRDSVVVGEGQILHQLRTSMGATGAAGTLDPAPERLFARAPLERLGRDPDGRAEQAVRDIFAP
jgi:glutamyl-tRNA reductase